MFSITAAPRGETLQDGGTDLEPGGLTAEARAGRGWHGSLTQCFLAYARLRRWQVLHRRQIDRPTRFDAHRIPLRAAVPAVSGLGGRALAGRNDPRRLGHDGAVAFVGACGAIGGGAADLLIGRDPAGQLRQHGAPPMSLVVNPATKISRGMPVWIMRQPSQGGLLARVTVARGVSCRRAGERSIRLHLSTLMSALSTGRCTGRPICRPVTDPWRCDRLLRSGTLQPGPTGSR